MEVSDKSLFKTLPVCEPWQTEDLSKQSKGFCTGCSECICQACFTFLRHFKAKFCKKHHLGSLDSGSVQSGLKIQEEKWCKPKETTKYDCLSDDSVVCGEYIVLDHPKCESKLNIDVANNFEAGSKFNDMRIKIHKWEADKEEGNKLVERNRKKNKALLENALQKLNNSRLELNNWLDEMEKEIEIEARTISDDNEALLSEMEKNLQAVGDDIDKIKEKIDTTLYQRETVFVNMVECKAQIDAIEALLSDIKTKYEIRTFAFEPENIVYKHSGLRIGVIPVTSDVNKEGTQNDLHGDLNLFSDGLITKAMFDYDAINDGDISFKKGDKLEVSEKESQNLDWWMARHLKTGQIGYIPGNYVRKDDNSPQSQDWWFDVTRKKAAKLLLLPGYPTGTFLVRESTDKVSFVLSVKDYDQKKSDAFVRHCRIHRLDNGGFYLNVHPIRTFDNVPDLISHYRKGADGMRYLLEMACPKTPPRVPFRVLDVARESVKLLEKLQDGSGCFGEVYAAKLHNTVDVAVKIFKQGQGTTDDFLAEAKLMNQLRHNRVVQLMAVCTKPKPIWIITELMSNGSLLKYLRNDNGKLLTFPRLTDMASQIADGMAYLETKKIVHRDLRAANILVGDYGEVKVANFGLARLIKGDIYKAEAGDTAFPLKWTAPEAVSDRKFSIKSDVWSYGVLLYELVTCGRVPYPNMNDHEVLKKVEKGYRMPKPSGGPVSCPDQYYEIMLKCWNRVAASRPTFAYLHNFFNNYLVGFEEENKAMEY